MIFEVPFNPSHSIIQITRKVMQSPSTWHAKCDKLLSPPMPRSMALYGERSCRWRVLAALGGQWWIMLPGSAFPCHGWERKECSRSATARTHSPGFEARFNQECEPRLHAGGAEQGCQSLVRFTKSAVVFPNKIHTEQQSLTLVKRLLAVAVSCITYLRGIFPESAYGTRYLDDLCVKILREDKNCPGSTQLVKWMLGCYDALQKKYLRMVVLATITECYHFKFKYTPNGPVLNFSSKNKQGDSPISCADTKKASILLIRKIYVLMQNLGPLPNNVCLTMKLFYYDEVTPPDYQPPGFKEGECEGMIFEGEPMYLNMGEVPTPFHMLKVKVTTDKQRVENCDESILKQRESSLPLPVLTVDGDEVEESQHIKEDPVLDNKVGDGDHADALEAQEEGFPCGRDEVLKVGENRNQYSSNPQVDHLARKTSELNVSEGRTRSGKLFQAYIIHQAELSSSQDVLPKRRKISEPKEQF
ncbi:HORMA domain-containing protein 1 isoform X2 [Phasianus colchicus]|uniref:HORMA domain-containing protein 1 isoform X2 n=1 Tax=Phasianus colchicus TaxID=9054 RepID=UPI00129D4255|nr:HORMA domain-containing protein 1 isoform X2 [Phasianus colchicus]